MECGDLAPLSEARPGARTPAQSTPGRQADRPKAAPGRRTNLAAFLFLLPLAAPAQGPVLIKEVISREHAIFVGQGPDKEVISREHSLFVGQGPDNQLVSREYSIVVDNPGPPPAIPFFAVTASPTGHTVTLDWSSYNQWEVRDVSHYRIYYSPTGPFHDVTGMPVYTTVPGETMTITLTGLAEWQDHYFAVVPVDGQGQITPVVQYRAAYVLMPQVISREHAIFVGQGPDNQVISREYSLLASDPAPPPIVTSVNMTVSPSGHTVTLDWSSYNQWAVRDVKHYAIYYSSTGPFHDVTGMTPFRIVPGETLQTTFNNLTEWQDHYFAVVPVDGEDNFEPNIQYRAAYVLMPQVISREVALFVGQGPDNQVVSREYSIVTGGAETPAMVTGEGSGFQARASQSQYGAIDLDWTHYNEWAQRDITRYRLYVTNTFFNSVASMPVYAYSANGTQKDTITGLDCEQIYHVAVVAEDTLRNYSNVVYSFSTKASVCELGDVANVVATPDYYSVGLTWDLGGIGTDLANFVSHFNVYVNGSATPVTVAGNQRYVKITNLHQLVPYTFRITTVDKGEVESPGVVIQATPLRIDGVVGNVRFWDVQAGDGGARTDGNGAWTEGQGNWNDGAADVSWSSTATPWALFGAGGAGVATVSVAGTLTAGGLAFLNGPVYTVTDGQISLEGDPLMYVDGGVTGVVSSTLGGSGGYQKTGAGVLRLSRTQPNLNTGVVHVVSGFLELDGAATGDHCLVGDVIVDGGTLRNLTNNRIVNTAKLTITGNGVWEKGPAVEGVGGIEGSGRITGTNTMGIDGVPGVPTLFSGSLDCGQLLIRGNNINGTSARQIFSGIIDAGASTIRVSRGNSADDTVILELAGSGTTKTTGWLAVGDTGAGSAHALVTQSHTVDVGTISGGNSLDNPGSLLQTGGTIHVRSKFYFGNWGFGTSTYTMTGGSLRLHAIPSGVVNAPNTTLEPGILYLGVGGTGIFRQTGGTVSAHGLVLDGWGETTGEDTYALEGGLLEIGASGIQSGNYNANSTYMLKLGGGVLGSSSSWKSSRVMTFTGTNGPVTFRPAAADHLITLDGPLTGPGGLVLDGPGTVVLSGAESYQGGTVVTQGVLKVTGSISHPGADLDIGTGGTLQLDSGALTAATIRIRSGGTLSGCGTVTGPVINDGTLAVDCGAGLTVNGTVTNNGRMRFIGGTGLLGATSIINNGILDLITGSQTPPPNLVNNGTVLFSGSVQAVQAADDNGFFSVSIASQPGHNYQLQRADSLSGPIWTDIGPAQPGTGAVLEFSDPAPPARRYYRFKVEP